MAGHRRVSQSHDVKASIHKNRVASNTAAQIAGQKDRSIRYFGGISIAPQRCMLRNHIQNRTKNP